MEVGEEYLVIERNKAEEANSDVEQLPEDVDE
jgi:hypothetical protein